MASHQHETTPESYGPTPPFTIESMELFFDLDRERTRVHSVMKITAEKQGQDMHLDGEELEFSSVSVNGQALAAKAEGGYQLTETGMTISHSAFPAKKQFELVFVNFVNPSKNTALSGLYESGGLLCTQCEAEGFRRITYMFDRPDVMTKYKCHVTAKKADYPVLLSNGNLIKTTEEGAKHTCVFEDPFKKPCYLFAVIAGKLGEMTDEYTYKTGPSKGQNIKLYCYADPKYLKAGRCNWAMECLKRAIEWDYIAWHRTYDLDRFSIVCIEDFNAGAMENKSLTTYNISCILGSKDTSSDQQMERVSTVIGHEYFHNWSGNRVTVESWFNVTLKEGLTNFREQEFDRWAWASAAQQAKMYNGPFKDTPDTSKPEDVVCMGGGATKRIEALKALRSLQFPEDAGPLAHPVCPPRYQSIDNFYTMTVYEKGSEVIGMLQHLVGPQRFRKGTDHYFSKYDGHAVNYHDFASAVFDAAGEKDYEQFFRWYHQKGTPRLVVKVVKHDAKSGELKLKVTQKLPPNASCNDKPAEPYLMPYVVGVLGSDDGHKWEEVVPTHVYRLDKFENDVTIKGVKTAKFVVSSNRMFAAPVILETENKTEELAVMLAHDTDNVSRWDAGQELLKRYILDKYRKAEASGEAGKVVHDPADVSCLESKELNAGVKEGIRGLLEDWKKAKIEDEFLAFCLSLPTSAELETLLDKVEPVLLYSCCRAVRNEVNAAFRADFLEIYKKLWNNGADEEPWKIDGEATGRRSLRNTCLSSLSSVTPATSDEELQKDILPRLVEFEKKLTNYNDRAMLFSIVCNWPTRMKEEREEGVKAFYNLVKDDSEMLNAWFVRLAYNSSDDCLARCTALLKHPEYAGTKNPNRFRSVVGCLSRNPLVFHAPNGEGYAMVADEIARFDQINPYSAAGICKQLASFAKYSSERQQQIVAQLKRLDAGKLSKSTREIVTVGLAAYIK